MAFRRLWVLVEGNDDEKFLERIMPVFGSGYDYIKIVQYRPIPKKEITAKLRSFNSMKDDVFLLADLDRSPCPGQKRDRLVEKYGQNIDSRGIIIVIKEIESWYLAGLDGVSCKELDIAELADTDQITKEGFNEMIPKRFDSRIDFMQEILKRFSVDIAKQKNSSFAYFMAKVQSCPSLD